MQNKKLVMSIDGQKALHIEFKHSKLASEHLLNQSWYE